MGRLKVAWLFVFGLIIIIYGLYRLIVLGFPYSEPTEEYSRLFIVMFLGLGVAGIGSAYGRHLIKKEYYTGMEKKDISKPPIKGPPKKMPQSKPPADFDASSNHSV